MFEKFGEFDSAEELNRAAAAQLAEGDKEAVLAIAKENGIDEEDAQAYIDGEEDELVTPLMAAYGKLDMEAEDLKPTEIMEDWIDYIRLQCEENVRMAAEVRRKGKSLKGCIARIIEWSFHNAVKVDKYILEETDLPDRVRDRVTVGIPGQRTAKKLIGEYYLGGES